MMRKHRPTIFYGVPSLYTALLAHPDIGKGAGSDRLRLCVSAGEALPAHIGERWREVVGVDVLDGIGSTELLQTFLSNRPGDIRYGSTGKPVPGYEARIVDENGRELGADEIGELIVRGPSAAEGYWNQRAKSRRTFAGEWTHTGDKFRRDADGYYYYCGRTDDMFKVCGMWVSPFDVEAALTSHEAVLEAAVIGKEDADGLIKPKAFIVLKNGYVADDSLLEKLKTHVKDHAGPWKYPRWIDVRTDLPRTATGKIQRFKLRDEDMRTAREADLSVRDLHVFEVARLVVDADLRRRDPAGELAGSNCGCIRLSMNSRSLSEGRNSVAPLLPFRLAEDIAVHVRLDRGELADVAVEGDVRQLDLEWDADFGDHLVPAADADIGVGDVIVAQPHVERGSAGVSSFWILPSIRRSTG